MDAANDGRDAVRNDGRKHPYATTMPPIAHAKLPRGASPARHRRCSAERSAAELAREDFVDRLRTCFAARRLHHLTDEPTDRFRIGPVLCDLVRIGGDDLVDRLLDGAQ